jgi:hypothetical protein
MKSLKLILPVALLLAFACRKEHNVNNVASLTDFPLATGDTWNYQVDDSINHTTQTAVFKITGGYLAGGIPVSVMHYTTQTIINGVVTDSGEILTCNDTVMYRPSGQGLFSNLTLLLPLTPNSYWHTGYFGDSVFVISANQYLTVSGNNYDSVYNIGRLQVVPDLYIQQNLFIAPHVGIVQQNLSMGSWIPVHKALRLMSYQLH